MENPVVVRAAEVCAGLGLTALRFNFRGVGGSTGTHGGGVAERLDVETAIDYLREARADDVGVALVGYSFGAMVAAHVAAGSPEVAALCLIAPPLGLEGASLPPALGAFSGPLCIVAGTRDDYCPAAAVGAVPRVLPNARLALVEGANHFFLGKLFPLGEEVATWARAIFEPRRPAREPGAPG
jgi:alpha/beta superfamily hydrolase